MEPHPLGNVPLNKLKLTFRLTKLDALGIPEIVPEKTGPTLKIDRIEGAKVGRVPLRYDDRLNNVPLTVNMARMASELSCDIWLGIVPLMPGVESIS